MLPPKTPSRRSGYSHSDRNVYNLFLLRFTIRDDKDDVAFFRTPTVILISKLQSAFSVGKGIPFQPIRCITKKVAILTNSSYVHTIDNSSRYTNVSFAFLCKLSFLYPPIIISKSHSIHFGLTNRLLFCHFRYAIKRIMDSTILI